MSLEYDLPMRLFRFIAAFLFAATQTATPFARQCLLSAIAAPPRPITSVFQRQTLMPSSLSDSTGIRVLESAPVFSVLFDFAGRARYPSSSALDREVGMQS